FRYSNVLYLDLAADFTAEADAQHRCWGSILFRKTKIFSPPVLSCRYFLSTWNNDRFMRVCVC
ncbi:hypothetical protein KAH55_10860, partial [bacterium]|nr:hypothetical protein [bacterium]